MQMPCLSEPTALRIQTRQSPYIDSFYAHHSVRITLDGGATGNMIRHSIVTRLGCQVTPSSQSAHQADGSSPLKGRWGDPQVIHPWQPRILIRRLSGRESWCWHPGRKAFYGGQWHFCPSSQTSGDPRRWRHVCLWIPVPFSRRPSCTSSYSFPRPSYLYHHLALWVRRT